MPVGGPAPRALDRGARPAVAASRCDQVQHDPAMVVTSAAEISCSATASNREAYPSRSGRTQRRSPSSSRMRRCSGSSQSMASRWLDPRLGALGGQRVQGGEVAVAVVGRAPEASNAPGISSSRPIASQVVMPMRGGVGPFVEHGADGVEFAAAGVAVLAEVAVDAQQLDRVVRGRPGAGSAPAGWPPAPSRGSPGPAGGLSGRPARAARCPAGRRTRWRRRGRCRAWPAPGTRRRSARRCGPRRGWCSRRCRCARRAARRPGGRSWRTARSPSRPALSAK